MEINLPIKNNEGLVWFIWFIWLGLATVFVQDVSALDLSRLSIPASFEIKLGHQLQYIPNARLTVLGNEFNRRHLWWDQSYAKSGYGSVNLTYIRIPEWLVMRPTATLLAQAYRVDLELVRTGEFRPTMTLEWARMELNVWRTHFVSIPRPMGGMDFQTVTVHEHHLLEDIYGGIGVGWETSLDHDLKIKAQATLKMLNQSGWEASVGLGWTPVKGADIMIGLVGQDTTFSWGSSKNVGALLEIGITF